MMAGYCWSIQQDCRKSNPRDPLASESFFHECIVTSPGKECRWLLPPFIYLVYIVVLVYLIYGLRDTPLDKGQRSRHLMDKSAPFSSRRPLRTYPVPRPRGSSFTAFFDLRVFAAKRRIQVAVDGVEVLYKDVTVESKNRTNPVKFAGLFLVVLEEFSGRTLKIEKYLTMQMGGEMELLKMLTEIQNGRIIILFESFQLISRVFLRYLTRVGASAIRDIKPGERWAMIWTKGGRTLVETKASCTREPCPLWQGGSIEVHLQILKSAKRTCDSWPSTEHWELRRRFCQEFEGYGNLCSCQNPLELKIHSTDEFPALRNTFVLIIASQKPFILSRTLKKLSKTRGFNPSKTVVSADGSCQEVADLSSIFGLQYLNHQNHLPDMIRQITSHYQFAFSHAFDLFPQSRSAIVLEEDLIVSPDFFSYFSQLLPQLEGDPSLYCLSAWNDFGFSQTSFNPRVVQRTDTMPGLGWMLTRTLYEELREKWPTADKKTDWDMWLRFDEQRKGRHCLIPEVSRTFHFGRDGVHTSSQTQQLYYDDRKLPEQDVIILEDLDRLNKTFYEDDLMKDINSSVHIDPSLHNPCDSEFIPRNQNRSYVLWFKMTNLDDTFTWDAVLLCLGMWSPDIRGGYSKVWKIRYLGTPLFLVGWPMSTYSFLKPMDVNIMRRSTGKENEVEPPVIIEKILG